MEVVADFACETGECPVWHPFERVLYWSDIPRGLMFRYDPATGHSETVWRGEQLGALVIQADGSILQFMEEGRVQVWRDGEATALCEGLPAEKGNRFNDAAADVAGGVLVGTMPATDGKARLYRMGIDGRMSVLLDDVGQSNGLVFSGDGRALYHTDTKRKTIIRYDYDPDDGHLWGPTLFARVSDEQSVPDGLISDTAGQILSAHWGGSCVVRYSPEGVEIDRIAVPTPQVASLAYGGESYSDLYITTAGGKDRSRFGSYAGALFRTRPDTKGCEPPLSRVRL